MTLWTSVTGALAAWEWLGILLARLAVGVLFALSGGGKLVEPARRAQMEEAMRDAGLPQPALAAVVMASIELVFGALLAIGFLTPLACVMLAGVMVGALATTVLPAVKATGPIAWLGEVLYLPEVLYLVLLVWLLLAGPGWVSVDHLVLVP